MSVVWVKSYYGEGDHYVDEWGVGWQSAPYGTPFGVGHYTEPRRHPLADAAALASYAARDPTRSFIGLYHLEGPLVSGGGHVGWRREGPWQ